MIQSKMDSRKRQKESNPLNCLNSTEMNLHLQSKYDNILYTITL